MAYSDYGAFVWCNGKRREDKEDVATFATDEETFGTSSENVPSGARIWISLLKRQEDGIVDDWINHIHHGIMGDGDIRVMCHKQGLPTIYEATPDGIMKRTPQHCELITKMGDKGSGYPRQVDGKCEGYAVSRENDEPCEVCKKCKYNEFYEE